MIVVSGENRETGGEEITNEVVQEKSQNYRTCISKLKRPIEHPSQ